MLPLVSALNFTPTSTGLSGPPSDVCGASVLAQMLQLLVHPVPAGTIVIVKALLAVDWPESDACTVKLNLPVAPAGVPLIVPFVRFRPPGSEPLITDQLYGGAPPLAVRFAE